MNATVSSQLVGLSSRGERGDVCASGCIPPKPRISIEACVPLLSRRREKLGRLCVAGP